MKQIELELKERLLIVELPNKDCEFGGLLKNRNLYFFTEKMDSEDYPVCIPLPYDCELICKGSELTEQVAKELVNNFLEEMGHEAFEYYNVTENDLEENHWVGVAESALQSFISSIEAQGYYWGENPFNERINAGYTYEKWQQAESRTFNPEKSIIFKILK